MNTHFFPLTASRFVRKSDVRSRECERDAEKDLGLPRRRGLTAAARVSGVMSASRYHNTAFSSGSAVHSISSSVSESPSSVYDKYPSKPRMAKPRNRSHLNGRRVRVSITESGIFNTRDIGASSSGLETLKIVNLTTGVVDLCVMEGGRREEVTGDCGDGQGHILVT